MLTLVLVVGPLVCLLFPGSRCDGRLLCSCIPKVFLGCVFTLLRSGSSVLGLVLQGNVVCLDITVLRMSPVKM